MIVSNLSQMLSRLRLVYNITMFQSHHVAKGKERKTTSILLRKSPQSTLIRLYRIYVKT